MATKKEIKVLLKELNLTENDMDNYWNELTETNWKVRSLDSSGKTWRDMAIHLIKQIPTQKEKDIQAKKEAEIKAGQERQEKLKAKQDKEYYQEHFEEIILQKIDNKEDLTERELSELVFEYAIDTKKGDNRRWSRTVTTIIEIMGRTFKIIWEEGLTEYQENEFYDQPYEVELKEYEKTITVKEWVVKGE